MTEQTHVVCGHCDSVVRLPTGRLGDGARCPSCRFALFEGKSVTLTEANFAKHVSRSDVPVVVDFWAPWCGPCIAMAPFFEKTAQQLEPQFRFAKLNTEDQPVPAGRFNIRSIPTLIVFHRGQELARQSGAMDVTGITRWLGQIKADP